MRSGVLIGLCVVLALAGVTRAGTPPAGPMLVAAFSTQSATLVTWISSETGAADFKVYGVPNQGAPVLLDTVNGSYAQVASGYAAYAVSEVFNGMESAPKMSFALAVDDCIQIDPTEFPYIIFNTYCGATQRVTLSKVQASPLP